jgi:hypothetical protein
MVCQCTGTGMEMRGIHTMLKTGTTIYDTISRSCGTNTTMRTIIPSNTLVAYVLTCDTTRTHTTTHPSDKSTSSRDILSQISPFFLVGRAG